MPGAGNGCHKTESRQARPNEDQSGTIARGGSFNQRLNVGHNRAGTDQASVSCPCSIWFPMETHGRGQPGQPPLSTRRGLDASCNASRNRGSANSRLEACVPRENRCCRSGCRACSCCGWPCAGCPACCSTTRPAERLWPVRPRRRRWQARSASADELNQPLPLTRFRHFLKRWQSRTPKTCISRHLHNPSRQMSNHSGEPAVCPKLTECRHNV